MFQYTVNQYYSWRLYFANFPRCQRDGKFLRPSLIYPHLFIFLLQLYGKYTGLQQEIFATMRLSRTSQKISRMRKKVGLQLSLISLSLRCIKYLVLIKLVFPTGSGLLYIKRWQKNAENYQQIFINHRLQRGHGTGMFKPISWVYLQIPTGHYHLFTGTKWHYINVNACISFTKKLFHIAENLKKKQIVQTILIWTD